MIIYLICCLEVKTYLIINLIWLSQVEKRVWIKSTLILEKTHCKFNSVFIMCFCFFIQMENLKSIQFLAF